jgi:riboflavin kinase/FMN adenylyltransferase
MLSSPERKLELLEHTGIDFVALLPFDEDFATWPPERFVSDVLVAGLNVNFVSVGQGWRFGHRAQGDLDLLDALGVEAGFTVRAAPLVEARGEPISSNRIRKLIAAGDLELAAELLGRVFDVQGRVVHGDQRGASLGFPTANVALPAGLVTPPTGVYAGRAWLGGSATPALLAAINIGVNPTFEAAPEPRLEAYLLDFDGDLYGSELRVELVRKLREEQAFESADALIEQIKLDVGATRDLLQP